MGGGLQSTTHIAHRALLGLALTFASSAAVTVKTALELRAAVASGTSETIFLSDDIHLGGRPLTILDRGANLTLDGQNHEISGGGESRVELYQALDAGGGGDSATVDCVSMRKREL